MENNIDKLIKNKLQQIEVEYQPDTWDLLAQKMDMEEVDAIPPSVRNTVDKAVYTAIADMEVPYNAAHWDEMDARLDAAFVYPQIIIRYKLAELSLLLLLIFGAGQLMSTYATTEKNSTAPKPDKLETVASPIADKAVNIDKNTPSDLSKKSNVSSDKEQPSNIKETEKDKIANTETRNHSHTNNTTKAITANKHSEAPNVTTSLPAKPKMLSVQLEKTVATPILPSVTFNSFTDQAASPSSMATNSDSKPDGAEGVLKGLSQDAVLLAAAEALIDSDIPLLENKEQPLGIQPSTVLTKRKSNLRVGLFAAAILDNVYTPRDELLNIDPFYQLTIGAGSGLSLSWRFKKWEIETGFAYTAKRYSHAPVVHIFDGSVKDGFLGSAVTDIHLNTVNIPLHLHYNAFRKNRWGVYGLAGGAMHLVMQANYNVDSEKLAESLRNGGGQGFAPAGGNPIVPPALEEQPIEKSSIFNRKNYTDGLLADSDFKANSYFSVDVGLGVERYLTPYWNVFVQPTLQYDISTVILGGEGIGPNKNTIHAYQILFGVKRSLE